MRIALDAMGGDLGVSATVKGAVLAVKQSRLDLILVGRKDEIEVELARYPKEAPYIQVLHAPDVIEMGESDLAREVRRRPNVSINVAMRLVAHGKAQAVVSTGNTGAVVISAHYNLEAIAGVERPAISLVLPSNKRSFLLLDVGATVDCKPRYLVQFAKMGSLYMKAVEGVENPRVRLLSNGEEPSKGNEFYREVYKLLGASDLNFCGNIEPNHAYEDLADVIVTDGFIGNLVLKAGEGVTGFVQGKMKQAVKSKVYYLLPGLLLKSPLRRAAREIDYQERGGGNLLGVKGVVIIAHGNSGALAVSNALMVAHNSVMSSLVPRLQLALANEASVVSEPVVVS